MVSRLVPGGAVLAVLLSVGVGTGSGAFPGRNGEILFSSMRVPNTDHQLYLMRPDGTQQRRLTSTPGFEIRPRWSPDGERIAYTKYPDRPCIKPYVVRANGTGLRRITRDAGCYNHGLSWSPNGRRIAVSRCSGSCKQYSIWTLRVDGTDLRQLSGGSRESDGAPAWSPDGTTIAFQRGYPTAIWLMAADGSNKRQLTTPPKDVQSGDAEDSEPDWSPDGKWIAFTRAHESYEGPTGHARDRRDIFLIRPDGTGLRRLTRNAAWNVSPAWSPDGKRIVFASNRAHASDPSRGDYFDIYVMNANGTRQTRLTRGALDEQLPAWRPRR